MFNLTDAGIFMKTNLTKGNIKAFLAKNASPSAATGSEKSLESLARDRSFAELHPDITPFSQDKIEPDFPQQTQSTLSEHIKQRKQRKQLTTTTKQRHAEFTFSDGFEAHFPDDTPLLWHQGNKRCATVRCFTNG